MASHVEGVKAPHAERILHEPDFGRLPRVRGFVREAFATDWLAWHWNALLGDVPR